MPLPGSAAASTDWPPREHAAAFAEMAKSAAWWSGDADKIADVMGAETPGASRSPNLIARIRDRAFDTTAGAGRTRRVHLPAAGDIAMASADLLFGEPPDLRIPEAHGENADRDALDAETRLEQLEQELNLASVLLEAAELAAAMGAVVLVPAWDAAVSDLPLLKVVSAEHALPEWRSGRLYGITLWSEVRVDGSGNVWRHLERHEPGRIEHGLYIGDRSRLGARRKLAEHPATRGLADETAIDWLPPGTILPEYVHNLTPNRKIRRGRWGRPDLASFDVLDALDATYTSWMRDLRVGQARIVVPREFLTGPGIRGAGASFAHEQEVFAPLDFDPSGTEGGEAAGIKPVEFALRTREHAETAVHLYERAVASAGYSPQTFGLRIEGQAESGTALRIREGRTLRLRGRKRGHFTPALGRVGEKLLAIDRNVFTRPTPVYGAAVEWGDSLIEDPREVANTVVLLRQAQAASIRTRVKMAQPHLEGDELAEEVDAILSEESIAVDVDPTGGVP